MLHLIALAALACPPSHLGWVGPAPAEGSCLATEPNVGSAYGFSVASSCGPGRLHGPWGEVTCNGCAVDVVVDATATTVTLDLGTLQNGERLDLEYEFTPDDGAVETLVVTAFAPELYACPDSGGGCDHAGGGTWGIATVVAALGTLRRRG